MHSSKPLTVLLLFVLWSLFLQAQNQSSNELRLWYQHPATSWNEALPVGNGRLGAMVFGGISSERLQLNEQTVWTGKPVDFVNPSSKVALPEVRNLLFEGKYGEAQKLAQEKMMGNKTTNSSYQTLGDLELNFNHSDKDVTDYSRELNLESAIAKVNYRVGQTFYTREIFSSAPSKVLVVRLSANQNGALTFDVKLRRDGDKAAIQLNGNEIKLQEHVDNGNGVKLVTRLKIFHEGGYLKERGNTLRVEKANAVVLLLSAATDYYDQDPLRVTKQQLRAARQPFGTLRKAHIADYQRFFKRVTFELAENAPNNLPTDVRLKALQQGSADYGLITLYYQFGRYLLISSSRPQNLPANLQGIWAEGLTPPWNADYHININIQMNYWPAEITNLSEMHLPFINFINALRKDGRKTAKDMYGMEGTVAHFSTDAWHYTETHGQTQWAMWPMGMAWSVQHLWEHFLFTGDKRYLANDAYPAMKEASIFCLDWLTTHPLTNKLVSGPSISPENTFRTKDSIIATMLMGPTMDHMIIRDLFNNTIEACKVLGKDTAFRKKLTDALRDLSPTQIGSDERIMEWTEEFDEPEPGHRHISHLFGLYPGKEINRYTPQLLEAARKTIDYRLLNGGGHTGWSRAWIINFFARLQNGDAAFENIIALLQKSTLPNLFDNHPPFQIDGNFGAVAGITEMLLQSHAGEVQLLPALPKAWADGKIRGIVARGGFEIDLEWQDGKLNVVKLLSKLGNSCKVRYGDKITTLNTIKGKVYYLDGDLAKSNNVF